MRRVNKRSLRLRSSSCREGLGGHRGEIGVGLAMGARPQHELRLIPTIMLRSDQAEGSPGTWEAADEVQLEERITG